MGFRPPSNGPDSLHGLARASPATSQGPFVPGTSTNDGFAPGHPLVKDGRRHYGSKKLIRYIYCDRNLEKTIRFSLKSRPSERFHLPRNVSN